MGKGSGTVSYELQEEKLDIIEVGERSLTVIGAFRCVSRVAGNVEHGTHDSYIDWIRRAVA